MWCEDTRAGLAPVEAFLISPARDLAQFDIELLQLDARIHQGGGEGLLTAFDENSRRFGLSRLWVLGAYELVRTVEEYLRANRGNSTHPAHTAAFALKQQFERLRIPLAKHQPARRHPGDWPIAYPEYGPRGAVGWRVHQHVFIERRELADALLNFLDQLAAGHPTS